MAFCELGISQEPSGAAVFPQATAALALAGSCLTITAQQVPPPGRGKGGRGPSMTPLFCWAALSCPPASLALCSLGVAVGIVSVTRSAAPSLLHGFFSCLLKDKVRRGKVWKNRVFLGAALGLCSQLLFPGRRGGNNLFVSVQKRPSVSMPLRTSHSGRVGQSALNDLKMVTLDRVLKESNKLFFFFNWKNIFWHARVSSLLFIRCRETLLFTLCSIDKKSPV